ncbi:hypothetical protein F5Y19DRAFT_421936 [Xylariaceae sp. FL1651]|nr:hypothetical protein F5Y19DRAFT_421936 [Xylariaceae sp. FL1651]
MAPVSTPSRPSSGRYHLEKKEKKDTPKKTAILTLRDFRDAKGLKYTNKEIFEHVGVPHATGYRILKMEGQPPREETRGRPRALSKAQIEAIIEMFKREGSEGRSLPWQNVCDAANLEFPGGASPHWVTVRTALQRYGWKKCNACVKFWTNKDTVDKRLTWALQRLHDHDMDRDFYRKIRYSDAIHFKFSPGGQVQVIRKANQQYCPGCIQDRTRPKDTGDRSVCINAWACIGYGFKSPLVWYEVNCNGNITPQAYLDQILKPYVGQWLQEGQDFILEDGGGGHGGDSENNVIRHWKEEQGLNHFFDYTGAPDLAPVEDAWKSPRPTTHRDAIRDEDALKAKALEGWDRLQQRTIDEWCDSVPIRLLEVRDANGQYTSH